MNMDIKDSGYRHYGISRSSEFYIKQKFGFIIICYAIAGLIATGEVYKISPALVLILGIIACVGLISVVHDFLYILTIKGLGVAKLASYTAKECVNTEFGELIAFKKVVNKEDIARNLSMNDLLLRNHGNNEDVIRIQESLKDQNSKEFRFALAKVEYLYDLMIQTK